MTLKVCFRDRLQFCLCIITAYCLMLNENQITVKENPIIKLSDANYAEIKIFQRSCPDVKDIVFQLKEILLISPRQFKITDFLQQSGFDQRVNVNVYQTVIPHQKFVYFKIIQLFTGHKFN